MIYQLFSIILSALFLLFMFWTLWYVAVPLLAIAVLISAIGTFTKKMKVKVKAAQKRRQPIQPNDIIDVDFKEVES